MPAKEWTVSVNEYEASASASDYICAPARTFQVHQQQMQLEITLQSVTAKAALVTESTDLPHAGPSSEGTNEQTRVERQQSALMRQQMAGRHLARARGNTTAHFRASKKLAT
eukprot:6199569-Pleurochrysis_carterae.AAC.1